MRAIIKSGGENEKWTSHHHKRRSRKHWGTFHPLNLLRVAIPCRAAAGVHFAFIPGFSASAG